MSVAKRNRTDKKAAGIGHGTPGPGRGKGTPNKITGTMREILSGVAEELAPEIPEYVRRVARRDPARAVELFAKIAQFITPTLTSTVAAVTAEISQIGEPQKTLGDLYASIAAARSRPVVGDFAETVSFVRPGPEGPVTVPFATTGDHHDRDH